MTLGRPVSAVSSDEALRDLATRVGNWMLQQGVGASGDEFRCEITLLPGHDVTCGTIGTIPVLSDQNEEVASSANLLSMSLRKFFEDRRLEIRREGISRSLQTIIAMRFFDTVLDLTFASAKELRQIHQVGGTTVRWIDSQLLNVGLQLREDTEWGARKLTLRQFFTPLRLYLAGEVHTRAGTMNRTCELLSTKHGIKTVDDLCSLTPLSLLSLPHMGAVTLSSILDMLETAGLSLKENK